MSIICVKSLLPGPNGRRLLEKWHRYEADVVGFEAPVVWDYASGCMVTDLDVNTCLNSTSGVLVTSVGHCHPYLVAAVQRASGRLLNNYECANVERIEAAERRVKALPPLSDGGRDGPNRVNVHINSSLQTRPVTMFYMKINHSGPAY